jgi:hypothetical protein
LVIAGAGCSVNEGVVLGRRRALGPFQSGPLDRLLGRWTLDQSPMFITMDLMSRLFSPYDLAIAAAIHLHPNAAAIVAVNATAGFHRWAQRGGAVAGIAASVGG